MEEGKLSMFGKTFNTVGSTDSNLILKTKGDLKILWGGKFIDLIKNGKIASADSNILKVASSSEEIDKDGIYLISTENEDEVWVSINGTKISIAKDMNTTYVSYITELKDITADLKYMALTNAGFYYNTLLQLLNALIKAGIVFVSNENKLYTIKEGLISEYIVDSSSDVENNKYFEELTIGDIRIYKNNLAMNIDSSTLLFWIDKHLAIDINSFILSFMTLEMLDGTYILSVGATNSTGYRLYQLYGKSILDIDTINLRGELNRNIYIEVTYRELLQLILNKLLILGKEYKIIDFQNSWEANTILLYKNEYNSTGLLINEKNTRPIIVKAKNSYELELNSHFFDDPEWILHYDYNFNDEIQIIDGNTNIPTTAKEKGRIIYLKDLYNNEANYDFKHLLFFINDEWHYTFSDKNGADTSLEGDCINNSIIIKNIMIANKHFILSGVNELVFLTKVVGNVFKGFEGITAIEGNFNNNVVYSTWNTNVINGIINNCIFENEVNNTIFNKSLVSCDFKFPIIQTDLFTKVDLNNCLFNSIILGIIEMPDELLIRDLKSLEPKQTSIIVIDSKLYLSISSNAMSVPTGAILMWAGIKDVPYGWAICDGKNGTPNLLGRFIKAVNTVDEIGEISSELNNENELIITLENLPKHNHPHLSHTHKMNLNLISEESKDLLVLLLDEDYNYGIESISKTIIKPTTDEETDTINIISNILTKGGLAIGGNHSHVILIENNEGEAIEASTSLEQSLEDIEWPNNAIKIEPRAYALIFIMKL